MILENPGSTPRRLEWNEPPFRGPPCADILLLNRAGGKLFDELFDESFPDPSCHLSTEDAGEVPNRIVLLMID